jgi:hypothetical protein
MQLFHVRVFAISFALLLVALPLHSQVPPSLSVGFYHWGGVYHASISEGVAAIAAVGGHVARLAISPRMAIDYGMGSSCIAGFTLANAVQDPDVKKALDNPAIDVFVLTAYDGVTFGDCRTHLYLNPGFYTPSGEAAIVQEYSDLTLYLYQAYQHSSKRFIISNWESDNDVYCGEAWLYTTNPIFSADCDANYRVSYAGNVSPAESYQGLRLWFEARQKGIEDGRNRALAAGIGGIKVYFAPEINICRCLHDAGLESALYDVIPYIKFDYVSYSSYQSTLSANPHDMLLNDLDTIEKVTGTRAIIIGEILIGSPSTDPQAFDQTLQGVLDGALSWGASYIIYWNLFSPFDCIDCGVYDSAGQTTPVGAFFENYLPGNTCAQSNGLRALR